MLTELALITVTGICLVSLGSLAKTKRDLNKLKKRNDLLKKEYSNISIISSSLKQDNYHYKNELDNTRRENGRLKEKIGELENFSWHLADTITSIEEEYDKAISRLNDTIISMEKEYDKAAIDLEFSERKVKELNSELNSKRGDIELLRRTLDRWKEEALDREEGNFQAKRF